MARPLPEQHHGIDQPDHPAPVRRVADPWPPLRGRDAELATITAALTHSVVASVSTAILVNGPAGVGKSRLRAAVAERARQRGFDVIEADVDKQLLAELGRPSPQVDRAAGVILSADHKRHQLIGHLRGGIRERLRRGPVLMCMDDLHRAGPTTLLAVRVLAAQFTACPLVWLLLRRTAAGQPQVDHLRLALRDRIGTLDVRLGPLDEAAVNSIVEDILDAPPDSAVRELAETADGNPLALAELLGGLVDDDAVEVVNGAASFVPTLDEPTLPPSFRAQVCERVEALSSQARTTVTVGAVLGDSFLPDDVAEMLGETVVALVPALDEALHAGILVAAAETFAFRHAPMRRAVLQNLSPPVRAGFRQSLLWLFRWGFRAV